jgi:hypothetical protein
MKSIGVVLSLLFAGVFASNVVDLTPETFDSTVKAGKPALVELYVTDLSDYTFTTKQQN